MKSRSRKGSSSGFDAERVNRANDASRVLFVPVREARAGMAPGAPVRLYAAPLSDEAIARIRAKVRAATAAKRAAS